MIALALTLLGFAAADLVRWSPERVTGRRACLAAVAGIAAASALAAAGGWSAGHVALVAAGTAVAVGVWLLLDLPRLGRRGPGWPLAWILAAVVAAFAVGGAGDPVSGPLERWYADLPFAFVQSVPVDQFVLGACAGLFLLATANRVVRLVLEAAGTPALTGEATLSGGRLLGPLERLFVASLVLAGELTGAAVIIAAKGLLRLPEIRRGSDHQQDHVTEYFLIGTFMSLLLAGGFAAFVSVSG